MTTVWVVIEQEAGHTAADIGGVFMEKEDAVAYFKKSIAPQFLTKGNKDELMAIAVDHMVYDNHRDLRVQITEEPLQ